MHQHIETMIRHFMVVANVLREAIGKVKSRRARMLISASPEYPEGLQSVQVSISLPADNFTGDSVPLPCSATSARQELQPCR